MSNGKRHRPPGFEVRPWDINRGGRPKLDPNVKAMQEQRKTDVIEALSKYLVMTVKQLKTIMKKSDDLNMIDRIVINTILGALEAKSIKNIELLLAYTVGRPKETIDANLTAFSAEAIEGLKELFSEAVKKNIGKKQG